MVSPGVGLAPIRLTGPVVPAAGSRHSIVPVVAYTIIHIDYQYRYFFQENVLQC